MNQVLHFINEIFERNNRIVEENFSHTIIVQIAVPDFQFAFYLLH